MIQSRMVPWDHLTIMKRKVSNSKVLNVALKLFSSKGYSETKMVDIARDAGLSVGSLYLRFKNKEELCLDIIKDQTKDYFQRAEDLAKKADTDALKTLEDYISFSFDCSMKKQQMLHIFYREYRLPFIQPMRSHFFKTQQKLIESILKKGIKSKSIRPLNTKDAAISIFASIRGTIMIKLIYGVGSPSVLSKSLFDLICHGVRKGKP